MSKAAAEGASEREGGGETPADNGLEPTGWKFSADGELKDDQPRAKSLNPAYFKHDGPLAGGDVWRVRVEVARDAMVGFSGAQFDAERHVETRGATAWVHLDSGTTSIFYGLSRDTLHHYNLSHLAPLIPKPPYNLAMRCEAVTNVPQVQFNDDALWHDFVPRRSALKGEEWFPYLVLYSADDRLSDHRVHRPRATKSAGHISKAPAGAAADGAAADGAAAVAVADDEAAPPPQKKARHEEVAE